MINEMNMNELDKVNGGLFALIRLLVGCVKKSGNDDDEVTIIPLEPGSDNARCKLSGGTHPLCPTTTECWDGPGGGMGIPNL